MNRTDLQNLTRIRLKETKALLDKKLYDGAYYLYGYAVECALKACLAKRTKRHDFPDKQVANESYTHDLNKLIGVAGLEVSHKAEGLRDSKFSVNWAIVKDWSEKSRYELHTPAAAQDLYSAVTDKKHGVLRWLRLHW